MQIKDVAARYENLLILSSVITEVTSHYEAFYKYMEYHENIIGFTSSFFTSSMDIVSITHELSKDYIEN